MKRDRNSRLRTWRVTLRKGPWTYREGQVLTCTGFCKDNIVFNYLQKFFKKEENLTFCYINADFEIDLSGDTVLVYKDTAEKTDIIGIFDIMEEV